MTTVSTFQENAGAETSSTSLLGRLRDWMINALDARFGLVGGEAQAVHAAEDYQFSNPCCCG